MDCRLKLARSIAAKTLILLARSIHRRVGRPAAAALLHISAEPLTALPIVKAGVCGTLAALCLSTDSEIRNDAIQTLTNIGCAAGVHDLVLLLRIAYAYCSMLTAYHLPLTTYRLPLTTYHLLLTIYSSLLTSYYSLLTTHYSLLTAYCLLLATHYSLADPESADSLLAVRRYSCCPTPTSHHRSAPTGHHRSTHHHRPAHLFQVQLLLRWTAAKMRPLT